MPLLQIPSAVASHISAVRDFFDRYGDQVEQTADQLAATFNKKHKLLVCGNGGSACDAQHVVGELVGRFVNDRIALPAVALTSDSGILTAVGNDYGYDHVFSRQVEALGNEGDMLIAISTSGSSPNIVKALAAARERKLYTVLLTGQKGANRSDLADMVLAVPSTVTARIQEVHILFLHLLTEMVEARMMIGQGR